MYRTHVHVLYYLLHVCFTGELIVEELSKQILSSSWLGELGATASASATASGARDPSPQEKKTEYYQHISKAMTGLFLPDVGFDSQR